MKQIVTGLRPEKKIEVESVDIAFLFFLQVEEKKRRKKKKEKNFYRLKVFFFFVLNILAPTIEDYVEKRDEVKIKGIYLLL
jgi:hypothetical protein